MLIHWMCFEIFPSSLVEQSCTGSLTKRWNVTRWDVEWVETSILVAAWLERTETCLAVCMR